MWLHLCVLFNFFLNAAFIQNTFQSNIWKAMPNMHLEIHVIFTKCTIYYDLILIKIGMHEHISVKLLKLSVFKEIHSADKWQRDVHLHTQHNIREVFKLSTKRE
jgi:hypothetical protein